MQECHEGSHVIFHLLLVQLPRLHQLQQLHVPALLGACVTCCPLQRTTSADALFHHPRVRLVEFVAFADNEVKDQHVGRIETLYRQARDAVQATHHPAIGYQLQQTSFWLVAKWLVVEWHSLCRNDRSHVVRHHMMPKALRSDRIRLPVWNVAAE